MKVTEGIRSEIGRFERGGYLVGSELGTWLLAGSPETGSTVAFGQQRLVY